MQLLETIKCENGRLFNRSFHQARLNLAHRKFFTGSPEINLGHIKIPENCKTGLFRCRVLYSEEIEKVEFISHQYRSISSLRLLEANSIEYAHKFTNRDALNQLFRQRANCDEILIVKNDCITDTSIANVVFWDGQKWWTPNTPLLAGTKRAYYLSEKRIAACLIKTSHLPRFEKIGFINAMWDLENMPQLSISQISI